MVMVKMGIFVVKFRGVVKFLVGHFDHGKFGFWTWSWSKFLPFDHGYFELLAMVMVTRA